MQVSIPDDPGNGDEPERSAVMVVFFASIPLMLIALLIATVPLLVTIRESGRERRRALGALEGPSAAGPGTEGALPTAA